MRPKLVHCVLALFVLWFQAVAQADSPKDWLRGVGDQLEIRLHGEVLDAEGSPAIGVKVVGKLQAPDGFHALDTKVDGHRFKAWVPVNQRTIYWISFKATLQGEEQVAFKQQALFELRQAAIDGIKLSLQVPKRQVSVKVTDKGKPVAGAKLIVGLNEDVQLVTDDNGMARLKLLPDQKLNRLTAWTDDYRIGGYGFNGTPTRDPNEDEHVVELSPCRNLKIRFIDQSGSVVPDFDFVLHVASPQPNVQYVGQTENSRMKTDSNGEAIYRWFPDWKEHHFYADSESDLWYVDREKEVVNDVAIFKLIRSRKADRKRVTGTVRSTATDVGGFFVSVYSFQGERKRFSDQLSAFTNADGTFSVDVLPDATYCIFGNDSKWVTNIIDLIPYQSAAAKITNPELTLSEGQQVEVLVTTGPDRKPYPNASVNFHTEHRYSWFEGKEKQNGIGGPSWFATTDSAGRIQTPANIGKLNVSVYTPLWQNRESHDVSMGQPTKITLHREVEAKRKIHGQLRLPDGLDAKLDDAKITIGALGGEAKDNQTLASAANGEFSFETLASPVGVFACTKDGRAAGLMVLTDQQNGTLMLRRTIDFNGQLIGADGKPMVGIKVDATALIEGKNKNEGFFFVSSSFEATKLEATTDQQGKYTIAGLPAEIKVFLRAVMSKTPEKSKYLGEVWLEENESRPPMVDRIGESTATATTLAERLQKYLRDSRLLGYPVMVILSDKSNAVADFVNSNFVNYDLKPEVAAYLQLVVPRDKANLKQDDTEFLNDHHWQIPDEGHIFACVLDSHGEEVGRFQLDVADTGAEEKAAEFVAKHKPTKLDAQKKWEEAFAEAKRTNRKVWARLGGRYCGPCFLLARWLDERRDILEKDYVMLKIDDYADENGTSVAKRLTRGGHFGIPFCAIFDSNEIMVIDSNSPLGNIGHPSGYEGSKYLRKMLMATRRSMTDVEVEKLVASLATE